MSSGQPSEMQDTTEGVLDRTSVGSLRGLRNGGSGFAGERKRRVVRRAAFKAVDRMDSIDGVCRRQRTSDDESIKVKASPVAREHARNAGGQHADGREAVPTREEWESLFDQ
jgi:hypothetical protein